MVRIMLVMMAAWMEANPEVTSRSLVYRGTWCTVNERAWFGYPQRLQWFHEEAVRAGALGPNSIMLPFILRDDMPADAEPDAIDQAIYGAVNAVRLELFQ